LEPGQKYYLEVLMKQAGGMEALAVAWEGPSQPLAIIQNKHLLPAGIEENTGVGAKASQ
jgi:hypothetical protein